MRRAKGCDRSRVQRRNAPHDPTVMKTSPNEAPRAMRRTKATGIAGATCHGVMPHTTQQPSSRSRCYGVAVVVELAVANVEGLVPEARRRRGATALVERPVVEGPDAEARRRRGATDLAELPVVEGPDARVAQVGDELVREVLAQLISRCRPFIFHDLLALFLLFLALVLLAAALRPCHGKDPRLKCVNT